MECLYSALTRSFDDGSYTSCTTLMYQEPRSYGGTASVMLGDAEFLSLTVRALARKHFVQRPLRSPQSQVGLLKRAVMMKGYRIKALLITGQTKILPTPVAPVSFSSGTAESDWMPQISSGKLNGVMTSARARAVRLQVYK